MQNIEENRAYDPFKRVYYSDIVGTYIVDAITGVKYIAKVGSDDEKKFFKIKCTTSYRNRLAKLQNQPSYTTTNQAFYKSPQEYMDYHKVKLSDDILESWNERIEYLEYKDMEKYY